MSRRRTPRPEWAAIDVELLADPKVQKLTATELVAYIASVLWTTKMLTDGHVGTKALSMAGVTARQAQRFVEVGLWTAVDDGWQLAGWHRWQKPRAEWLKLLEHRRHASALGNCQRWHEEWCRCLEGDIPVPKRSQERSHLRSVEGSQKGSQL